MAEYVYNYHDIDLGSHKRQRIGPADQHLWPVNEALTTDLTPHTAYGPVRNILHDGAIFAGSSCFEFANTSLNDSNLWYQEPTTNAFHESYSFEDQNTLLTSQPICEQTAAAFVTSFQDDFDEPQGDFPQGTTEANVNELAYSVDVEESPPQGPTVICFGMVCLNPLIVLLQDLTWLNTDCRRPCAPQSIGLFACRIRVSSTEFCSTKFVAAFQRWPRRGVWEIGRANSQDFCKFTGREWRTHPDVLSKHQQAAELESKRE
jgi:hypothetical protein